MSFKDQIDERIITLQLCINSVMDSSISEFCVQIGASELYQQFFEERDWTKEHDSKVMNLRQFQDLKKMFKVEMLAVIDRIKSNPIYLAGVSRANP